MGISICISLDICCQTVLDTIPEIVYECASLATVFPALDFIFLNLIGVKL